MSKKIVDRLLDSLQTLPIDQIAETIGIPVEGWAGNCYGVATAIVRAFDWRTAAPVYGNYWGPVDSRSEFAGKPYIHHGWILTMDGTIVDPTRWVFEAVDPYIAVIARSKRKQAAQYDEGSERLAQAKLRQPPQFDPSARLISLDSFRVQPELLSYIHARLKLRPGSTELNPHHLFWLANVPYSFHGTMVYHLYVLLESLGVLAYVPIDYRIRARREHAGEWGPLPKSPQKRETVFGTMGVR